jgi:multicomponent Na+:H+ antiporter subunit E
MERIRITSVLHRTVLLGAIWVALTGADGEGLALGLVAVPAAVWLSVRLMPGRHPPVTWRLALHLPRFMLGSVTGGADVARRALATVPPLRPGWVAPPVDLPDGARVALGGVLSLMPGTLAAGGEGERLLVHLIDTDAGFDAAIGREAAAIGAILGVSAADGRR